MSPDDRAGSAIDEARREIAGVKHAYCWSYDSGDLEALVDLFTDDAVCDFGEFGCWQGRDDIRREYAAQMAGSGVPGTRMHTVANPWIEVDGDDARGRWYLLDLHTLPGHAQPVRILGRYDDTYRRENGRWRIARTSIDLLWLAESGAAAQGASSESAGVRRLLDEAEIRDVATDYALALDTRDWDRLKACFTDDCVVEYEASGDHEGRDAVAVACRAALEPLSCSQHFLSNFRISVDGDAATSLCYFTAQHVRDGRTYLVAGTYTDELTRTVQGWRIARRRLAHTWESGDADVLPTRSNA